MESLRVYITVWALKRNLKAFLTTVMAFRVAGTFGIPRFEILI